MENQVLVLKANFHDSDNAEDQELHIPVSATQNPRLLEIAEQLNAGDHGVLYWELGKGRFEVHVQKIRVAAHAIVSGDARSATEYETLLQEMNLHEELQNLRQINVVRTTHGLQVQEGGLRKEATIEPKGTHDTMENALGDTHAGKKSFKEQLEEKKRQSAPDSRAAAADHLKRIFNSR